MVGSGRGGWTFPRALVSHSWPRLPMSMNGNFIILTTAEVGLVNMRNEKNALRKKSRTILCVVAYHTTIP